MIHLAHLGWTCYAPDMPGFGGSFDPTEDPPGITWYADLYHDVFSKLPEFEHGCHILGHHSGGVIGIELAVKYPASVRSLTCVGPTVMSSTERTEMSKTFLEPFNKPFSSGDHLKKTWEYLIWEGISSDNVDLLQREALDHIRAWKGRSQIYRCVWDYDCGEALKNTEESCKVLGLCAEDDVLWPFFENFKSSGRMVEARVVKGGNFGPDLDCDGIVEEFLAFVQG